jgi:hypothetical protein
VGDVAICGANKSRGRGICRATPLKGASRCRFHGGRNQQKAKLNLYTRHLPADWSAAFSEAKLGSLDEEIRLAKANLDKACEKLGVEPEGGITIQTGTVTRITTHFEVVLQHIEQVRKLVQARADLKKMGDDAPRKLDAYKAFLKKHRKLKAKKEREHAKSSDPSGQSESQ